MGRISKYAETASPDGDDLLIGTDVENDNATKNFTIQSIVDFVIEEGINLQKVADVGNTIAVDSVTAKGIDITLSDQSTVYQNGVVVTIPLQTTGGPGIQGAPDAFKAILNGQSPDSNGSPFGFVTNMTGADNIGFVAEMETGSLASRGFVARSKDNANGSLYSGDKIVSGVTSNVFKVDSSGNVTINVTEPTAVPFYTNNFASGFGDFVQSPNNDAAWTIVSGEAKSGTIPDNGKSGISLTKSCPTDVTILQYTYRTSTEQDYDYLFVILDGKIIKRYSGSISSTTDSIAIQTIGDHTIQFVYSKDISDESGVDTVWLDNVSLTSGSNALTVNKSAYFKDSVYLNNASASEFISTKNLYANTYESRDANGDIKASYKHDGISFFDPTQNDQGGYFSASSVSSSLLVKVSGGTPIFNAYGTANTAMVQIPNSNANVHIGQYSDVLPAGYMLNVAGTSLFKDDVTVNASISATTNANLAIPIKGVANWQGTGVSNNIGVLGESYGESGNFGGIGVKGISTQGVGVYGEDAYGFGVCGKSSNGAGVKGEAVDGGYGIGTGVYGQGGYYGVHGRGDQNAGGYFSSDNGTFALISDGPAGKPGGGTWSVYSDSRVKQNVSPYTKGLAEILLVNTVNFEYNGLANTKSGIEYVGIIAQDMKDVFPETVSTYKAKLNEEDEEETELYSFDANALTFALINAVKQLSAEIELLKSK